MAAPSREDSIARPGSGQKIRRSTRPQRRGTYPGLCRPSRSARCGLARSSLKMKRVDPARARVSASHGGCDAAGLQGHSGIGSQVEPAACEGSVLCFVAPSTCMGPPLTESPGWCQVIERNSTRRSPSGASTTAGLAIHGGMAGARRNGGNRCTGIRCRARHQLWLRRASGAPGDDHRQVANMGSTNDFYRAATSGVTAGPIRGSGLQRRVTTATPFAPHGAGHKEGRRELSVDTGHQAASRRWCRNRRVSPGLTGGVETALDAAPFSARR